MVINIQQPIMADPGVWLPGTEKWYNWHTLNEI